MNSTTKTILIIVVVAILLGLLFTMNGWSFGKRGNVVDEQYADLNGLNSDTQSDVDNGGKNNSTTGTNNISGGANTSSNTQTSTVPSDATILAAIGNATIRVPQTGVDVRLYGGEANFVDGTVRGYVSIGRLLAKVPTDEGYDAFVDMAITTESKEAVIHYVALFRYISQAAIFTSAVSIGDRVGLYGLTASADKSVKVNPPQLFMSSSIGYLLTLSYLDRKNGEPITANPTLPKTMSLRVKNHIVSR